MVRFILLMMQLPSALLVLYLDVLSVAAVFRQRTPAANPRRYRFAVLIPAHNEEALLPRLLRSTVSLDYPRELYDVHVVADNCTDRTADLALAGGAAVHERQDERLRGKGHALRWLLTRLAETETPYDAYVIVDADSVLSTNFLDVMTRHMARGDSVIQGYYGVLNCEESWSSTLRYAALALYNNLRPRGRDALGLSAGLRGNGMCFTRRIIERFGWPAFTLAEDVEFHFSLVEAGFRVTYASEASVLGEMPTTLQQAGSQNVRWERGRLQMLRAFGPRLLAQAIRQRDPVRLEVIMEQLVPPLSVLTGVTTISFAFMAALRKPAPRRVALMVLLGQIAYVVTGLQLVRAKSRVYFALLGAPFYIVWKSWIYLKAMIGLEDDHWIRTARTPEEML